MAARLIEVLSEALSDRSEVRTRGQSLMAGEKMFAYAKGDDLVIKLPADEVQALLRRRGFSPHVVGTKVMPQWVVVSRSQPAAYLKDVTLLRKAVEFTANPDENSEGLSGSRLAGILPETPQRLL